MKDTDLYQQVLGLSRPWQVREVKLELDEQRVTVRIECDDGVVWGAPGTGGRAHIHGWSKRQWRHLDTCQFETVLEAEVPSVKYADGRVEEVAVPWAERYSRVSKQMEAFVIRVLQERAGPGSSRRPSAAFGTTALSGQQRSSSSSGMARPFAAK